VFCVDSSNVAVSLPQAANGRITASISASLMPGIGPVVAGDNLWQFVTSIQPLGLICYFFDHHATWAQTEIHKN